jgi:hypothetical protein
MPLNGKESRMSMTEVTEPAVRVSTLASVGFETPNPDRLIEYYTRIQAMLHR